MERPILRPAGAPEASKSRGSLACLIFVVALGGAFWAGALWAAQPWGH